MLKRLQASAILVVLLLFHHACGDDNGTTRSDQTPSDSGDVDETVIDASSVDSNSDANSHPIDTAEQDIQADVEPELPILMDADLSDGSDVIEVDTRPPDLPLACGLDLVEIALFQSVSVVLMQDGVEVAQDHAPIVPGKQAIIRVHVRRQPEWEPREVFGRVVLRSATGDSWYQTALTVDFDSVVDDLTTTLNMDIPARGISADTRFQVSLVEINSEAGGPGHCENATWPLGEPASLEVEPEGAPIEIVLVPIRYNADDSARLPDTSPEQLERYEDAVFSVYPVQDVELSVLEPIDWDEPVQPNGVGWNDLLNAVVELREEGNVAPQVYYYGLVTPTEEESDYAGVTGLGFVPFVEDSWARCAVGLGYSGQTSANTMLHEIAHNHGRSHAPCGSAAGIDPNYPYPDGNIGQWGFDLLTTELKSPTDYFDFMAYCEPIWISDYTYAGLFERTMAVHALSDDKDSFVSSQPWASLDLLSNEPGPTLDLRVPPRGEETTVLFLDVSGNVIEEEIGTFVPYDHLDSGLVLYPMPSDDVISVGVVE